MTTVLKNAHSTMNHQAVNIARALKSKHNNFRIKSSHSPFIRLHPIDLFALRRNPSWHTGRMCCDFVVEPKIGVDEWNFSSSP
jgi:hypothetical protein